MAWDDGRRHIWAGDFNSLTEDDKSKEGWEKVAKEREASKGFKRLEEPKFEVTKYMVEKNFSDCWAKVGEKGPTDQKETCR